MISARVEAESIKVPVVAREDHEIGLQQLPLPAAKPCNQGFIVGQSGSTGIHFGTQVLCKLFVQPDKPVRIPGVVQSSEPLNVGMPLLQPGVVLPDGQLQLRVFPDSQWQAVLPRGWLESNFAAFVLLQVSNRQVN